MFERIVEIIREQLGLSDMDITEDTSLKDDMGADSLDLYELVLAFEEEFGVELPVEDLENVNTVGDIIDFIKEQDIDA